MAPTLQYKVLAMIYDVAVIGAGLAGLRCARLLSGRGLRVILLDRRPSIAGPVQTTGIFVRKTWEDFPLPESELGPPIRDVVLHSPRGRSIALRAARDEFRIGRMSWLYLSLLEQSARAGTTWLPGARLVSLDGESLTVVRHGREQRIRARFVIGADGARSTVASLLGLERNRRFLIGLEEVIPPVSPDPVLHCFLDPRLAPGYIAWVANDGEEAHLGVAGWKEGWNAAAALEQFRASLPFAVGKCIERRGGLIPVGGILGRIACERGLVVGDAAGAVSPLTAGGLDGAMRLSTLAADVTLSWLDGGGREALSQYTGDRFRARFLTRMWMRRLLNAVSTPLAAEAAFAALRLPLLRRIAEQVFFARGSFPDIQPVPGRLLRGQSEATRP